MCTYNARGRADTRQRGLVPTEIPSPPIGDASPRLPLQASSARSISWQTSCIREIVQLQKSRVLGGSGLDTSEIGSDGATVSPWLKRRTVKHQRSNLSGEAYKVLNQ